MKVKFPEPVNPTLLYKKEIKNKKFNSKKLTELVENFEVDLDKLFERVDDKIVILDYYISFQRKDTSEFLEFESGGMDLSVKEGREYALPDFKRRYKETFKSLLEKTKNASYPVNIEISIIGFGDKITHEISAKNPAQ